MSSGTETEVKLRVDTLARMAAVLKTAGFRETQARVFEANTLFDTPDKSLLTQRMLLRLREAGGRAFLTWKGPIIPGPHKARPELETTLGSAETVASILQHLGYVPVFRYEKFRTEFRSDSGAGVVELDETPIGSFLELEGEASWIDRTAELLGFSASDYLLDSYGALYRKFCAERGVEPANMVFPS
jgi:adenylate cyclase class 2